MTKTTLSASLTWPDVKNDFLLRYDGHAIGRILDESIWAWQISIPMLMPVWAGGTTDSLEEAKNAFAAAWEGSWLKPARSVSNVHWSWSAR